MATTTTRAKRSKRADDPTAGAPARGGAVAKQSTKPGASRSRAPLFDAALLRFLGELTQNNDRAWFERNKPRYEQHVRGPALDFIRAMAPRLARVAPHLVASDQKVGGSLMRIHRDTRFSADKTPYKTNVGIQFRHAAGKDVHAPGLYLHVEASEVFLGSGLWHPDRAPLEQIRQAIAGDPKRWRKATSGKPFAARWSFAGESLKRPPRGYDPDHPAIEDLKRKDHIVVTPLSTDDLLAADLPDRVLKRFREALPHFQFLLDALGLPL
ncbi:MAG: DUF2461 domain-containing protein [Myxococcales bacterium]|nr:DUF2461 domain-containing protein [Myxococcales bacterium]